MTPLVLRLPIKDLDKSLQFYKDILGLSEDSRLTLHHDRLTQIRLWISALKNACLELSYYWDAPLYYKQGKNILSLDIHVSADEFDAMHARFAYFNYAFQIKHNESISYLLCVSPDKFPLRICKIDVNASF